MADDHIDGPRVAPGPIKGSGSKAPWIVLGIVIIAGIAMAVSILIAVIVLRS